MANFLPFQDQCCTPCTEQTVVNVPGAAGAAGAAGTNGVDGVNAYTLTSAAFVMPAFGANVTVAVLSSVWMAVGQFLFVQTAGYMSVVSKPTTTSVILQNVETGLGPYAANVAPGTNIASGITISPGGIQGTAGALTGVAGPTELEGNYPDPTIKITSTKGDLIVNNNNAVAPRNTRLGVGADGRTLHANSATATGLEWAQVNLASAAQVTGALPIANGGTGQIANPAAFDALSPLTTNGDLIYRNATNNVRLAPGTAVQVLHSGTPPTWGAVVLTTDVTGVLPRANGGTAAAIRTVVAAGADNVLATDDVVIYNAGGAVAANLPTAVGKTAFRYVIKRSAAMGFDVTVNPLGGETIDGAASFVLNVAGMSITIISDNANWFVI